MTEYAILVPGSTAVLYENYFEPDPRYRARLLAAFELFQKNKWFNNNNRWRV
ncbi:MAG: hypothetical protein QW350_03770 [Candidatus Aenigmatarchaeota archaeon]